MFKLLAATSIACLTLAGTAVAQTAEAGSDARDRARQAGVSSDRNEDRRRPGSPRRGRQEAPSPERVLADATAITAVAVPTCQPTEANLLGAREDGTKLYEVACATGPGYILEAVEGAPKANDCVLLWSVGQIRKEEDPAADVGAQCALPGNQNAVQVIAAYGREAGVECEVDQAVAVAVNVYEIGCASRDGWLVEKSETGWTASACWQSALTSDLSCRYSTREEAAAEWPKLVAGTDAAACSPQDVRWVGQNAERGVFYELKCASGDGIIVRFKDGAGQQIYACADAERIFRSPCTLTPPAQPAAVPAESGGRA